MAELNKVLMIGRLTKDPELRYPTADALAHDLRRWLRCEPVEARQPGVLHRIGLFARRRRQAFVASVFAVVLGLAAVGTIVVLWLRTEDVLASLLEARSAESQQREVAQAARAELDEVRRTLDQLLDEENPSLPSTIARTSARQVASSDSRDVSNSIAMLLRLSRDPARVISHAHRATKSEP